MNKTDAKFEPRVIGYECDGDSAERLKKTQPYVEVRNMCVNSKNIIDDMRSLNVPLDKGFTCLKTDIDSVDITILDSILRAGYRPKIVFAELAFDWPPPLDFGCVGNCMTGRGCFGVSINLLHRVLQRHGYRIIYAANNNALAIHPDLLSLPEFKDMPYDPWHHYQFVKSPLYHSHWSAPPTMLHPGIRNNVNSPFLQLGSELGLYSELLRSDGVTDKKPRMRTVDRTMRAVAAKVKYACKDATYMLAIGDRCCAPQWGVENNCVCSLPVV